MTIADILTREQNGIFRCGGAWVRAHRRQLATVVTIRGEIDAVNAEQVGDHIRRFILGEDHVVLDMGEVSQFAPAGLSLLQRFDEDCRAEGVQWTLVASPAVGELLGDDGDFPYALSVHEALHDVADAIATRRRLALPLIKTS
ncbi:MULTISPECIES: STAS domain-containing protein [unclassified Mycobacterium]|uniref:STAS domain-containing protein n=1 Tax=unclassified Mycobacterium TaxID=2642494 RepID=UPI0006DBEC8F|nr:MULTISPECIES: STAS domain-containing protein [unclassified Mycobacterium]